MKIYFSGSIRGGRADQKLYQDLIRSLGNFGKVLTEHVGDMNLLEKERLTPDEEIYQKDRAWLEACDVLVAEVTTPSLGVGYEIGAAESLGKKVLCLFRQGADRKISAMIAGNPNLTFKTYQEFSDAERIIAVFFR